MEWIKSILPIFGVVVGWVLSEKGKINTDKRQDQKKLNKLLFFLLELRFQIAKTITQEQYIIECLDALKLKIANKFAISLDDNSFKIGDEILLPFVNSIISTTKNSDDKKLEFLIENIDKVLLDLAEIFPILAYELNGQYNIKDRLFHMNEFFDGVQEVNNQIPPTLNNWINSRLSNDILFELDKGIIKIADKINDNTKRITLKKMEKMNFEENKKQLIATIDELLEQLEASNLGRLG